MVWVRVAEAGTGASAIPVADSEASSARGEQSTTTPAVASTVARTRCVAEQDAVEDALADAGEKKPDPIATIAPTAAPVWRRPGERGLRHRDARAARRTWPSRLRPRKQPEASADRGEDATPTRILLRFPTVDDDRGIQPSPGRMLTVSAEENGGDQDLGSGHASCCTIARSAGEVASRLRRLRTAHHHKQDTKETSSRRLPNESARAREASAGDEGRRSAPEAVGLSGSLSSAERLPRRGRSRSGKTAPDRGRAASASVALAARPIQAPQLTVVQSPSLMDAGRGSVPGLPFEAHRGS